MEQSPSTETTTLIDGAGGQAIAYLPIGQPPALPVPRLPPAPFLAAWLPPLAFPGETARVQATAAEVWLASAELRAAIAAALAAGKSSLLAIASQLEQQDIPFHWYSLSDAATDTQTALPAAVSQLPRGSLNARSRVLALIPHYRCERWLRRCLRSLVSQTRPLEAIVVLDDASSPPPLAIVQEFPSVTLLAAGENVGPYRLIQQAIDRTNYDAYLFQDADDWSCSDRLALLLQAAAQTGAELLGTQVLRCSTDSDALRPVSFPLNVNHAVARQPGHPLAHPTSLVSRALIQRLGGFATGLRFGGDTEFVLRAVWQARVENVPQFCYFRRQRPQSLTTAAATGLGSPARTALTRQLKSLARARQQVAQDGQVPDCRPLAVAPSVELTHLTGPDLAGWRL